MIIKLPVKTKEFYPGYLSEILIAIFLTLWIVFILAMLFPPSLGWEINFISPYQPKPEWYFLWLYQAVRYFPGKWTFIGTVAVPLLAVALALCIPCIDRGTAASGRIAAVCFTLLLGGFLILTLIPVLAP
ncbi:MAG: hypothetical protein M1510_11565 [Nitrospirae bacterium]|nr:hypothetical protein [Nitrospirota bacterium]MCL5238437.1 hypothetical protein [Nitrospirota bacterium]